MIDCIIYSWDAVLKVSAHDVGRGSGTSHNSIRWKFVRQMSTLFYIADIVMFVLLIFDFSFKLKQNKKNDSFDQ